ncbi:MAG TPA: GAF domain-containing sensor histidine kinase [Dehalococcoidia bacterium]|nr:GAF domain-containing sensor histidine kinase [Dehalococcoidia bacterium]
MKTKDDKDIQSTSPAGPDSGVQEQGGKVPKPYRELLALSRISAAVSGLRDLDGILEVALDTVLNIMNGTIGGILFLDEQTQTLSYRVHRGLSEGFAEGMSLKIGEGIAGRVAQSGKAVLVEDISTDPRAAWLTLISKEGLKAFISVPLRSKDTVLGVLNVASRMPRSFTKDDMHLLHAIGDQLGVAIEQAELYDRLRKERQNYQRLARHMLIAQEEERARVARELHDETSQSLTGLSLNMQALLSIAKASNFGDAAFRTKLEKAYNITFQLNSEINKIMKSLRATALESLGLGPAIRQYADNRLQAVGVKVSVKQDGVEERLPKEVELALYRIAQGAIANIAWHSQAKNATFSLRRTSEELVIEIEDDGKGFDASKPIQVDESGHGRGLLSMKERASLLGGTCDIQSQLGKGTKITVRVPTYRITLFWSKADAKDKSADSR